MILGNHNLVFTLSFPPAVNSTPTTPLWEEAETQIQAWFRLHQLEFENRNILGGGSSAQTQQPKPFHQLDWRVMQAGRTSVKDRRRKIDIHGGMSGNQFFQRELAGTRSKSFSNPLPGLGTQPLLFLCEYHFAHFMIRFWFTFWGPRYTELIGNLETFPELVFTPGIHRCFSIRILHELTSEALLMRCFYGHTTDCIVECHSNSTFCPQSMSLNQSDVDQNLETFASYDFDHRLSLDGSDAWELPRESRVHLRSPESQVSSRSLLYCMQLDWRLLAWFQPSWIFSSSPFGQYLPITIQSFSKRNNSVLVATQSAW